MKSNLFELIFLIHKFKTLIFRKIKENSFIIKKYHFYKLEK